MKKTKKSVSEYMRELGRKGGKKTAENREHMRKIGRKGQESLKKKITGST